jgi:hypothetical protein
LPRKSKTLSAALKYQLIWPEPDPVLSLIDVENAEASAFETADEYEVAVVVIVGAETVTVW